MFRQHYVREVEELSGSLVHIVSYVQWPSCFVSAGGGGQQAVCAPPAPQCTQPAEAASWIWPAKDTAPSDLITSCAFSALQPWGTGVNVAPTLPHSEKSALLLFIYLSPLALPVLLPLLSLFCLIPPPGRASLFLPALFSPHRCILLEMWIKVTAGAAGMTESACLQGHLSPSPPPFDSSCPPPPFSALAAAATLHIILDLVSTPQL